MGSVQDLIHVCVHDKAEDELAAKSRSLRYLLRLARYSYPVVSKVLSTAIDSIKGIRSSYSYM